ncbi:DUF6090 family protein [Algoriphagus sp.]|uniref:DUF6090 family protein n=1 Tax=Algoriphagus sp. TaxID=1872435 RepID=UPI0025E80257|nr:DUF6090 family protein [Algoriphagus sp.]
MGNKTGKAAWPVGKYLKYAIGEIVLVVIGILIALGVNNWNEERIGRNQEKKILKDLYQEFDAAAIELQADLTARERYLRAAKALQHHHLTNEPLNLPGDSIKSFMRDLLSTRFYSTAHPILDDLSASGGLELIQSDSIRLVLGIYLEERNRYTSVEEREGSFTYEQIVPFFSKAFNLSYIENDLMGSQEFEQKLMDMRANNQFGSLIQFRINRVTIARNYGDRVMTVIQSVLSHLEKELNIR